jgi:hypothetical protein
MKASRTNSMPPLNQSFQRNNDRNQKQSKILHATTFPLTEDKSPSEMSPVSPLRTERTNPLVDLAVSGRSQREAHNAELGPYIEKKAHVVAQLVDGSVYELEAGVHPAPITPYPSLSSTGDNLEPSQHDKPTDDLPGMDGQNKSTERKRKRRRKSHNMAESRRRGLVNETLQRFSSLPPQPRFGDGIDGNSFSSDSPESPHELESGENSSDSGLSQRVPGPSWASNLAKPRTLPSSDQRDLLDRIYKLRVTETCHYVELPQLVICGDQLSGRSSVLEALSVIPFPRNITPFARFPTEIILQKSGTTAETVNDLPHHDHSESDHKRLAKFHGKPIRRADPVIVSRQWNDSFVRRDSCKIATFLWLYLSQADINKVT